MLVSHILKDKGRDVLAIAPETTLLEAARVLTKNRIGALIVLGTQGILAGIISERDIVKATAEDGINALTLSVAQRMTKNVATCKESDTIEEIMEMMTRCRFRHLPVMDKGRIAGIISIGDVVKTRIAETLRESQALKEYIATS